MDKAQDKSMLEVLKMQKADANTQFFKFIEKNYINWLNGKDAAPPTMSHTLIKNKFIPVLDKSDNFSRNKFSLQQVIVNIILKLNNSDLAVNVLPDSKFLY